MSPSPFAALQSVENRLVPAAFDGLKPDWLLEIAPATSPSPSLAFDRCRLLFNDDGYCWPFRSHLDELPLDSESVPAVLLRHLWQPGLTADPLPEVLRILKPGGSLVSVSANPWHAGAWRELGRSAMWLPSWPHFQLLHARLRLDLSVPPRVRWQGLVPGLTAVLVLVARKPARPARIRPLVFRRPTVMPPSGAVSQCRAA